MRRSAAMGTDAAEDKFEITFHRSAVALLVSSRLFDEADRYSDMVRLREVPAPVAGATCLVYAPQPHLTAQLFTGRVLEALNRPADAAQAYERADALYPGAQTPAVALASLHQRQGALDKAATWAARARSLELTAEDPWWQYFAGDLRFYPAW